MSDILITNTNGRIQRSSDYGYSWTTPYGLFDESGKVWSVDGSPLISTSLYKFGPSSLNCNTAGAYNTPDSADFSMGSGDFTIDFWFRLTAVQNRPICYQNAGATNTSDHWISTLFADSSLNWSPDISLSPSNHTLKAIIAGDSAWHHVACVRYGNIWTLYLDGVVADSQTFTFSGADSPFPFTVGGNGTGSYFNGYLDEFRVSKGIARWITPFSVPTTQYALDAYTVVLLHFGSQYVISFCDMGSGKILALSKTGYVLRSTDGGQNWSDLGQKITETLYWEAEQNSRLVYLGNNSVLTIGGTGASKKIFKSVDSGDNWTTVDLTTLLATNGEHIVCPVPGFVNGECFIATVSNLMPGAFQRITNYIWRSTDYGSNWAANGGIGSFGEGGIGGRRIKNTGDGYLVGVFWYKANPSLGYYYAYKSKYNNSTTTWSDAQINSGGLLNVPPLVDAVGVGGSKAIYSVSSSSFFPDRSAYSSSPYSSWSNTPTTGPVSDFFYLGSYVFYCSQPGGSQGVYRSSAVGAPSWSQVNAAGADELLGFPYSSATADFTGTPTVGTANLTVQFTDASIGATSWNWNFGDGGTSTLQNPSHIYTASGLFTVTLSVNSGASVKTRTDYINVSLVADFTGTPVSGSAPLTVLFTDTTQGEHSSWAWDFGDGGTSTLQNPSHVYTLAGTYTVVLSVNGGESIKTRTNYITVSLLADFTGTPVVGAAPLEVQFTDSTTGGPSSWMWDFGDGVTSTLQNPTHIYNVANIYTVMLSVNSGASIKTRTNYVTANLTADFEASPTIGDANSVVTFTDTSLGNPTAWLWDFGDAQTSSTQNPHHTYTNPGVYTVALTVYRGSVEDTLTKVEYLHINIVLSVYKLNYIIAIAANYTRDIAPPELFQPMYKEGDISLSFIRKGIKIYILSSGLDVESGYKRPYGPSLIFD